MVNLAPKMGVNSEIGREAVSRRWRIARRIFLLLAIIIGVIFLMGVWEEAYLRVRQQGVQDFADNLKKLQDEDYRRAMADTYGGKTPQETLQLYIAAVEKGDYELASRYFILNEQAREKDMLLEIDKVGNIDYLVAKLESVNLSGGYFSSDGKIFTIEHPAFIELRQYPSGIWKIVEI